MFFRRSAPIVKRVSGAYVVEWMTAGGRIIRTWMSVTYQNMTITRLLLKHMNKKAIIS